MKKGYIIKHFAGTMFFFFIIFLCAGRFLYMPGLIYLAIGIVMATLSYTVLKPDQELLAKDRVQVKEVKHGTSSSSDYHS